MRVRTAAQRLAAAAVVASGPAVALPAQAAVLPLGDQPYGYTILDQDLRDTLRQFGANNGLRVVLSDAVQGRVRGRLGTLTPQAFLDRLAGDFGFDWFYDGLTLYFSAVAESVSRLVPLGGATNDQLQEVLHSLGLTDARFTVRALPGQGFVMVSGPPRFVELVQQAATALAARQEPQAAAPPGAAPSPGTHTVTIYRGREEQRVRPPER